MSKTPTTVNFEIKPLNEQEYSAAPEAVRRVYISVLQNIPLSNSELKATIKAHPAYFTLKRPEVKKTFGQNVKRLFALKGARESMQKKLRKLPEFGDFLPGKVSDMRFIKKQDVEFPPACNGNCGMNYCDENGCIERKRELVDPSPDIAIRRGGEAI